MIDVMIIDDHSIVRSGIRRLLAERGDVTVHEAETAEEGVMVLNSRPIELIILDLNLPGLGGIEVLRRLRRSNPELPVLIFTMHTDSLFAAHTLEAGACGYISKAAPPKEILAAVDAALKKRRYIEKSIAAHIRNNSSASNDFLRVLTKRDLEILRLLAGGKTVTEVAISLGVAYKTVANTCGRLRGKMGVRNTIELINVSRGIGLL